MQCDYVTLSSGLRIHYRRAGSGPPLILLHPSPQDSTSVLPAVSYFDSLCECFALDTPGYGLSDDLLKKDPSISDYADIVIEAADALGLGSFYLYGSATGSQIAIEVGKRAPDRVRFLMLDMNGHIADAYRESIIDDYFPDVTAKRDGGHLLTYWDMCRQLSYAFPWSSEKADDRLGIDMPSPQAIQERLLVYLQSGEGYAKAYKTSFCVEKREHLDGLRVPTVMTRWAGSLVLSIVDELIGMGLPKCLSVLNAGPSLDDRYSVQRQALKNAIARHVDDAETPVRGLPSTRDQSGGSYIDGAASRIHARVSRSGSGAPVICLHGAVKSSAQMAGYIESLIGRRPVYSIDLPGHGASARPDTPEMRSTSAMADQIADALIELGLVEVDLIGEGLGGAVAAGISRRIKTNRFVLVNPVLLSKEEREDYLERGLPDIDPRHDGSHLVKAWAFVRDKELFWPWYDYRGGAVRAGDANLSPDNLHQQACDLMKTGLDAREFVAAEVGLDWKSVMSEIRANKIVLLSDESHPCRNRLEFLLKSGPSGTQVSMIGLRGLSETLGANGT